MPILSLPPHRLIGNPPQVRNEKIPDGHQGNLATVEFMRQVAAQRAGHPLVRGLALQIIDGIPSNHYLDESRAIGAYVQRYVRYVRDPVGKEQLTDPVLYIDRLMTGGTVQGDCDDMSLFIASLLGAIGHHEATYRMVRYNKKSGPYHHIYVVDYERNGHSGPRKRIVLDAIMKNKPMGYEVPHVSGDEVPVF